MPEGRAPDARARVVQVNTHDEAGGAARVAWELHAGLLRAGDTSMFAVGRRSSSDRSVSVMDNNKYRNPWSRFWLAAESSLQGASRSLRGKGLVTRLLADLALPARTLAVRRGLDYFGYPAAWHPDEWAGSADLIHLHNLHGDYFDLRALPSLTARYPTVLTSHDAWLLAGHCAHSFDCERWRTGCGRCPDLSISPAVSRDATARNWRVKHRVFAASRLYVATPSRWLMDKVEASMLAPAIVEARVIPNGIELEVFKPQDKQGARTALGLPVDAHIALFAAHGGKMNRWKDFPMVEAAAIQAGEALTNKICLIVIGGQSGEEHRGRLRILYVPYVSDRKVLAAYIAAADVCVHAVHAESFSLWLGESLACGTPPVSVRVGAIPEVVKDGVTGLLVDPGDRASFARALVALLEQPELRNTMGKAAAEDAAAHLGLQRMVDAYRGWYRDILSAAPDRVTPPLEQGGRTVYD